MQRGFQRTAQQQRQNGLQRTTQLLSSTEGRVTRAPAQRAPAAPSQHCRAVWVVYSVACGALVLFQDADSHHSGGQVRQTLGPVARRHSARHVELLASCQRSQRAMSLHGSASNCACVTGAFRASAARRQADSRARRCTARRPRARRGGSRTEAREGADTFA